MTASETPAARNARRDALIAEHGKPEKIADADALAQAAATQVSVDPTATAEDVYASIYRDAAAADAWLEANLTYYGHPALARVPLADGRVIGILDLRPAFKRMQLEDE